MKTKIITLSSAAAALALVGSAQAAYGPEAPQPTDAPGGYQQVMTAKTVGGGGGTLSAGWGNVRVNVSVPAGASGSPVQFRIVAPKLSTLAAAVRKSGFRRVRTVTGVAVSQTGVNGGSGTRLKRAVKISLSAGKLGKRAFVLRYDAAKGRYVRTAFKRENGRLVVRMVRPVALVVVTPTA
ncbi:hypothetical protein [Paraconexibacter sp. AEG42_29]|uniref:hypothetical protein n=1 Tax=Paraconexibacter sp. AEG42_29 TaxID=2997339 RepID=UPI00339D633B